MLQVGLQHCCWASYQITKQADIAIANLAAFRGVALGDDLESIRWQASLPLPICLLIGILGLLIKVFHFAVSTNLSSTMLAKDNNAW